MGSALWQIKMYGMLVCEYVALAVAQKIPLVTGDRTAARLFPEVAVLLEDFASGS